MKTNHLLRLSTIFLALLLSNCQVNELENEVTASKTELTKATLPKKVLIVGFDGMQFEKISQTATPNLDKLNIVKAYSGGIDNTSSGQKTSSGPGWSTIWTGVWVNKHGVANNNTSNKSKARSVFQLIKESNPAIKTASVITWGTIHDYFRDQLNYIDHHSRSGGDENSVTGAIHAINNQNADVVFVHLDDVDGVGHSSGFGTAYNNAITRADDQFGRIMAEVEKRTNEDWLVMVVTDHGRGSGGYNHGGQTTQEKTIFVGMNKSGNEEFSSHISDIPNKDFGGLYGHVAQTALVPTVLTHLDIPIQKEWQLNSTSLIGDVGVRKVMMRDGNTIYWNSSSNQNVKIYKNNTLLATVPATQGSYTDTSADGKVNYTLVLNGQSASVSVNKSGIIACLDWNDVINNRAYFFRSDNQYVRYNKTLDRADSGYPVETNNSSWPGLEPYRDLISAAFKWHNHKGYFFLKDGRYLRYDMNNDAVDPGYPAMITNGNWPGLEPYKNKIVAAVKWNNSRAYFFLNDGTYIRYNITQDKMEPGYPATITDTNWPGVGNHKNKITAAVDWNSTYFYFFLDDNTYIKYNKITDRAVSGYPKPINNTTWPGLNN